MPPDRLTSSSLRRHNNPDRCRKDFENLLIEMDLDESWSECLEEHQINDLSDADDYEPAFFSLLKKIYNNTFLISDRDEIFVKIILAYFEWSSSSLDYKLIYDDLKKLDADEELLKKFSQRARKIVDKKGQLFSGKSNKKEIPVQSALNVFIIHGHDEVSRLKLEKLLREFKLLPIVLMDMPGESLGTIISKFEREASSCSVAIALFTPDDEMKIGSARPRQNVILELGYFMGRDKQPERKIIVLKKAGTEGPSDINGVETINFEKSIDEIAMKLKKQLEHWKLISM
jgi:hypothetical protein